MYCMLSTATNVQAHKILTRRKMNMPRFPYALHGYVWVVGGED